MNNNINKDNIIPCKSYINLENNKFIIYEENRKKPGIYRWNNLITEISHVGSTINLSKRLSNYFSQRFLKKEVLRSRSIINNSLLEYGYNNFSLDILEYCEDNILLERELYYLDLLKPEYNICKIAGSRLGTKHSLETLLKYKNRTLSPEALINLKLAKKGIAPSSPLIKISHLLTTGHITTVVNKEDNSIKVYSSVRAAARDIGINHVTVLNYINSKKWLKGIYFISRNTIK